jgi:hypothetical protein
MIRQLQGREELRARTRIWWSMPEDHFATETLVPGFTPPELPTASPTPAAIEAADKAARHWASEKPGPFRPGSEIHKSELCKMFRDTFNPYRPSVIAWPSLAPEALRRITSLPIWDIAVQTEGKARLRMAAYAATVADPDIQASIALNAWEENRHKDVLSKLVQAYGIPLASEPEAPRSRMGLSGDRPQ